MPSSRRKLGDVGEKAAAMYLERKGYHILKRNFRCREGEIDIVARQGECLVFVEVRTKKSSDFGTPEESLTPAKRVRLMSLADAYLQTCKDIPSSWRIDLVAIELTPRNMIQRIEHIENAIS